MNYEPQMIKLTSLPATYEQLAEECNELAKAALKYARILRGENPTPVTRTEAMEAISEEWSDVYQVAHLEIGLTANINQMETKALRLRERCHANN